MFTRLFFMFLLLMLAPQAVHAQAVDILPAQQAQEAGIEFDNEFETHPPLRITPDKSELIRLKAPAGTIIIGNPSHFSVLAESPKTLVIVPGTPGSAHFMVLNKHII